VLRLTTPGPGLVAHVLVSKYCDHTPLHRQSVIYAREGVELDRATLADWVGHADVRAQPRHRPAFVSIWQSPMHGLTRSKACSPAVTMDRPSPVLPAWFRGAR